MKKLTIKFIILLSIIGLNWLGLLAVGRTSAYYSDIETSKDNLFQAGTLLISAYPENLGEFKVDQSKNIKVERNGDPMRYRMRVKGNGSSSCDNFEIKASLNGNSSSGDLVGFSTTTEMSDAQDNWDIDITDSRGATDGKINCEFEIVFEAWQISRSDYSPNEGFSDIETIKGVVESTDKPEANMVSNEVLANNNSGTSSRANTQEETETSSSTDTGSEEQKDSENDKKAPQKDQGDTGDEDGKEDVEAEGEEGEDEPVDDGQETEQDGSGDKDEEGKDDDPDGGQESDQEDKQEDDSGEEESDDEQEDPVEQTLETDTEEEDRGSEDAETEDDSDPKKDAEDSEETSEQEDDKDDPDNDPKNNSDPESDDNK